MPLKVELPDVPPLKAVINRKTIYGWQKGGSTFTYQTTQLKIPILHHTGPHRYLIIACSVAIDTNNKTMGYKALQFIKSVNFINHLEIRHHLCLQSKGHSLEQVVLKLMAFVQPLVHQESIFK